MPRKLPAALVIVSVLLTIPSLASWIRPAPADAIVLTPGGAEMGVRSTEERVEFWLDRIETGADHLNRVHAARRCWSSPDRRAHRPILPRPSPWPTRR